MHKLHSVHTAHTRLSSRNIMVNTSDYSVQISDYGLSSMVKYARDHGKYYQLSSWSAVEMWSSPTDDFASKQEVDVFSFGMLLWEIETEQVPFEGKNLDEVKRMLVKERLRP